MLQIFGYRPAWGLPDVSPFVSKVVVYLHIASIPFEYKRQNTSTIKTDAPYGKLPYIIDIDGTKVADSHTIIRYLQKQYDVHLDNGLSTADLSIATAFERLACEHLMYAGLAYPRWMLDAGFEDYRLYLLGETPLNEQTIAGLNVARERVKEQIIGQGMGLREEETVFEFFKVDIAAVSGFLGEKKYFMGDQVTSIDATIYAILRHIADQTTPWIGQGYVQNVPNLVAYLGRMREEFKV